MLRYLKPVKSRKWFSKVGFQKFNYFQQNIFKDFNYKNNPKNDESNKKWKTFFFLILHNFICLELHPIQMNLQIVVTLL